MITKDQLRKATGAGPQNVAKYWPHLTKAMAEFEIDSPKRIAAFLAQIAHESGSLKYVRELASGAAYEDRADLGNIIPGDGRRFRGRGLIQITGRANYLKCAEALQLPLLEHPEMLETPRPACRSAAWWWSAHGCNELADSGDFERLTRRINGGLTGLEDRVARWDQAKAVIV